MMADWKDLKGKFNVVAWSYHHEHDAGTHDSLDHPDRVAFYDYAKSLGVDVLIDYHSAADLIHDKGMKLIVMSSVSPNDPDDPMGYVHWGKPCIGGGEAYGNVKQLAWYEKHFGDHPAVIGYCLNESCKPCTENVVAARWLLNNAPGKLRYVSYGEPDHQNAHLFPVASFSNSSYDMPEHGRSKKARFADVAAKAKAKGRRRGCKLWWPIIPVRTTAPGEVDEQISMLRDAGADGVVLFPFSPRYDIKMSPIRR